MATLDTSLTKYRVDVIESNGTLHSLDEALLSVSVEELDGELAKRCTLRVVNLLHTDNRYVMSIIVPNTLVRVYSSWNGGAWTLVFEGNVWDWSYSSAQTKELSVTAYDGLIRLQQSKGHYYFSVGQTTRQLLEQLCGDWGITLNYAWGENITHEKELFQTQQLSAIILSILDKTQEQTGKRYVMRFDGGVLTVVGQGENSDVWILGADNTTKTDHRYSLSQLVTRVVILGKADKDGKRAVTETADGLTEFGVLQEIVTSDSAKSLDEARKSAADILKERGTPAETITVQSFDIPFLRRGDRVELRAGDLLAPYIALGISHDGGKNEMTVTLGAIK